MSLPIPKSIQPAQAFVIIPWFCLTGFLFCSCLSDLSSVGRLCKKDQDCVTGFCENFQCVAQQTSPYNRVQCPVATVACAGSSTSTTPAFCSLCPPITLWKSIAMAEVKSVAFHPQRPWLAIHTAKQMLLWDIEQQKIRHILAETSSPLAGVAFSPDGQWLAASSVPTTHVWELVGEQYKLVASWDIPTERPQPVFGYHRKQLWLLLADRRGVLHLWSASLRRRYTFQLEKGWGGHVAFRPDGSAIASFHGDDRIGFWRFTEQEDWQHLQNFVVSFYTVGFLFTPDGSSFYLALKNARIETYDAHTGRLLHQFPVPYISSMILSQDGKLAASSTDQGLVWLWDTSTWQTVGCLASERSLVWSLAFSLDRKALAVADNQGVTLWHCKH